MAQRLWYRFINNDNHVHDCHLRSANPSPRSVVMTLRVLPEGLIAAGAAVEVCGGL
jgi:hypothetical protein